MDGSGRRPWCLPALFLLFSTLAGCREIAPPYTPQAALDTFQLEEGFRIELFAGEPLIQDPVAMDFDPKGRIFVVEMPGYPLDTKASGRVKLLEDTDGDGYPDRSQVFVDGLVLPTGVMAWKNGILVTAAPDVWYFEDSDGDGRADVRRVVLTGFAFSNPQHTVSDPIYGLDNWIYLAHEPAVNAVVFDDEFGDPGSEIRFPDQADGPALRNTGRNIRFKPDTHDLEVLAGSSQFGHTFDQWGRHFTVNNSNHIRHEVIARRYLERNPYLLVGNAMHNMSDHGSAAQVFPITRDLRVEMLTNVGRITSACGLLHYLGGGFGSRLDRVSFVAEPVHNLVHRDVWQPAGSTFVAQRAQEEVEFLASTDSWFRPVFLYVGPDSALYVVDYYRQKIEHPEWMARESYESDDLYAGKEKGRIYRIVPSGYPSLPPPAAINLDRTDLQQLVKNLENSNIWWRRAAQRLLVEGQDVAAVPLLTRLFHESTSPPARAHALWTLEGLGQLTSALIENALQNPEPGVRENAILLAEPRLSNSPSLPAKLLEMSDDSDPRVRFQLLCTLGSQQNDEAQTARDKLLLGDVQDEWMQIAALSADSLDTMRLFHLIVARVGHEKTEDLSAFLRRLCSTIGARRQPQEVRSVLQTIAQHSSASLSWPGASLEGLATGLSRKSGAGSPRLQIRTASLLGFLDHPSPQMRVAALRVLEALGPRRDQAWLSRVDLARRTAKDQNAVPLQRADAIQLLALFEPGSHEDLLKDLFRPQEPESVQVAAVTALGRIKGSSIGNFLLQRWQTMTPDLRDRTAEALFSDDDRASLLLDAIAAGDVQAGTLTFRSRRRLIMHRDPALREHARDLLERTPDQAARTLGRYQESLQLEGSVIQGDQVFERECARCHVLGSEGSVFGPDLATVRNRPPKILLVDILMPTQSIASGYELYVLRLHSGAMLEGVIASRTPNAIRLVHEDGKEQVVGQSEIAERYASQLSAMPEGLEDKISVAEMADLIAFLKGGR